MIKKKRKEKLKKTVLFLGLFVCVVIVSLPFFWMVSSSFKDNTEVFTFPIHWIPKKWHVENYREIWTKVPLLTFFKNTIFLSVTITMFQLLTSSIAAYGFSKLRFKGRNLLFFIYIMTIAVPWQAYMIPQFVILRKLGLVDNLWALVLLQSFSAFSVFMMKQFYETIPDSLCESARMDGLSEWGIYWKIILPLSKPVIASLTIITFVNVWNDYMGPFIYLSSTENKTIQVGLKMFIGLYDAEYAQIMAASVVSIIPITIVFLCMQKYFVKGIASSGIKG